MDQLGVNRSHKSMGKLDAYSELASHFPNIPVPDFDGDCKGMPTEWWFPEHGFDGGGQRLFDKAREVCDGCHARQECLDFSLDFPNLHGMWGGLSPRQRQNERRRRRYRAKMDSKKKQ